MDRSTRIASIIEDRQPLIQKIEKVESNLRNLSDTLHQLGKYQNHLLAYIDDSTVTGKLKEINFSNIDLLIASEAESLTKLKNRFSRKTLNIGVVGRARQGKSRLLQSLTGLSTAEIPDGDRQHCTGVRSTIHHNPNVDTYGEVWFYTERTFIDEVIAPYYEKLHLGTKPFTVEEFFNKPLPSLPSNIAQYAELGAMYEHLKRYHTHSNHYRHLLRESSPKIIQKNQIREYVAQDNTDGQRLFFSYLAVREVKIACSFPNLEVDKIALVDMPGLGDTGLGDEERLIKALGQDIDFILFVRMPKSSGDYWADFDIKLYDAASSALIELPLYLWSFVVLNHTQPNSNNGNNLKNCQDLLETLEEKHIKVEKCLISDCSDQLESNKVLDAILDYLSSKLPYLDQQYASLCEERLQEIYQAVTSEINKAKAIFNQDSEDDYQETEELYSELFGDNDNGWWRNVALGLQELRSKLQYLRQTPNDDLQNGVITAIEQCEKDKGILSLDNALEQINTKISLVSAFRAYPDYQDELRVLISHRFLSLDDHLKTTIEFVKNQVASILKEQGSLNILSEKEGSDFFREITEQIPERLSNLKNGFKIITDFQLSYRGLILPRIRQHLDGLTNVSAMTGKVDGLSRQTAATLTVSKDTTAEDIFTALKIDYKKAIYTIKPVLEELLCEPNEAAYALVEEFIDSLFRQKDIQKEWKNFLRKYRGQIWAEDFGQKEQNRQMRKEWLELVNQVISNNQAQFFTFIK